MNVWAFNSAKNKEVKKLIYESINSGKSRFGWSSEEIHNLNIAENRNKKNSKQLFLLRIKPGDWIVHINMPRWGMCTAAQVISEYDFDEGLSLPWGKDFRHHLKIDTNTVIEFSRKNCNILPSVNLNPRSRYHKIYSATDFIKSIENVKNNYVCLADGESSGEFHLKEETEHSLKGLSQSIHKMNKSKTLEPFIAKVFRKIPEVIDVKENGFGWKSDNGADLIVTTNTQVGNLEFKNTIIVQIKSYEGTHNDLHAVDQIKTGIEEYGGTAGMLITTAKKSTRLEDKISEVSDEIGLPIDLLAAEDVSKFVIKHAPELLFKLT